MPKRAGLIPLDRVLTDTDEQERFLMKVLNDWNRDRQTCDSPDENELKRVFTGIVELVRVPRKSLTRPYTGIREQRASLRSLTAFLIGRYIIDAVSLRRPEGGGKPYVAITPPFRTEVKILKQLTWEYVINAPALATQQYGQRKLIEDLFEILADAASTPDFGVFPPRFRELLESGTSDREISRVVADYISGMTEREAIELHQRLTGASLGSVLDPFSP